ncbi:PIPO, partial [Tobacco vein banding mosaic virus]|uniref:PIPO n=1 Tax=Tobacco vein banding mosaic virus TaxID=33765 RepID=UPI000265158B
NLSTGFGGALARFTIVGKVLMYTMAIKASKKITGRAGRERYARFIESLGYIQALCTGQF